MNEVVMEADRVATKGGPAEKYIHESSESKVRLNPIPKPTGEAIPVTRPAQAHC